MAPDLALAPEPDLGRPGLGFSSGATTREHLELHGRGADDAALLCLVLHCQVDLDAPRLRMALGNDPLREPFRPWFESRRAHQLRHR
jgi:hypothetical protein